MLITLIYKLWAIIIAIRITPYIQLSATKQQAKYKQGRPTIDILPLVQNSIQQGETHRLILVDPSKAIDSIGRNAMWGILDRRGIPCEIIKQVKMGHNVTRMCAKHE